MFDGKTKNITISDIDEKVYRNDDGTKTTMIKFKDQDGLKYKFYSNRKSDGKTTAAYEAFEQGGFKNGTEVEVAYKEVEKSFVNDAKKTINYIDRFVSFFNSKEMKQIPSTKKVDEEEIDTSGIPF